MEFIITIFESILLLAIGFFTGLIVGFGVNIRRADNMPGIRDVQNALWNDVEDSGWKKVD